MTATAYPYRRAVAVNSTSDNFTNKLPTTTKPSGEQVINLFDAKYGIATETYIPKFFNLQPFGDNADGEVFEVRVWGWSKDVTTVATPIWIPQLLLELTVTLGNIAATALGTKNFMADTIAI